MVLRGGPTHLVSVGSYDSARGRRSAGGFTFRLLGIIERYHETDLLLDRVNDHGTEAKTSRRHGYR